MQNDKKSATEVPNTRTNVRGLSRRRVLQTAGAGFATAGLAGCQAFGGGGQESGTFKMGANLALSQGWEPYGNTMLRAAEIAADEINNDGGLDGREIEIIAEDNQIDPQTVRDKANKLITQDEVDILFGPISSASRNAMASVLQDHEIPTLYPVQYEGPAAEDYCNEWIYKIGEIPIQQIQPFIPWLMDNYGESFYLLGSDYVWPQTMNDLISEVVEAEGGTVLAEEYVSLDTTDFTSIIPRIEEANPDILFMELTGASVAAIQDQMQNRGVRDQWTEVGLAHGQGVIAGASAEAVEGVLACHAYFENLENEANQAFVSEFRDRHGEDALINYLTGTSYAALKMLQQAVDDAGGTSIDDIKSGMDGVSVSSVVGESAVEVDQTLTVGTTVAEVNQEKKYEPVTSFDTVTPEDNCDNI